MDEYESVKNKISQNVFRESVTDRSKRKVRSFDLLFTVFDRLRGYRARYLKDATLMGITDE